RWTAMRLLLRPGGDDLRADVVVACRGKMVKVGGAGRNGRRPVAYNRNGVRSGPFARGRNGHVVARPGGGRDGRPPPQRPGAGRGIGRALALGLARAGCAVVVAAKSTEGTDKLPGSIHSVAAEVEAAGGQALAVRTDVRDADQIDALAARTLERFGRVDILVN